MFHMADALYEQKMPRRAKQLFVKAFAQHHKPNAGDEDAALQKARQALEERYVRVSGLEWIPRRAAYEIIRDEMSDDSDPQPVRRRASSNSEEELERADSEEELEHADSEEELERADSNKKRAPRANRKPAVRKRKRDKVVASKRFKPVDSSDEDDY
ncbi:ChaB protein [Samia ricini nucleopolyhedrovirus]|nr:ChaB [Philosamia cynthia ricini nucleopolyhedrovirus virus]BBD51157.1 ChaB protein [Samia ricini nucleopolyhedrovirus]BBD51309.1 ChaB protein [Samia ricini nucleopolyhedrovirus]BBD51461.1 ChaB protein [Samia ricini nucleopolyhedrovirus]